MFPLAAFFLFEAFVLFFGQNNVMANMRHPVIKMHSVIIGNPNLLKGLEVTPLKTLEAFESLIPFEGPINLNDKNTDNLNEDKNDILDSVSKENDSDEKKEPETATTEKGCSELSGPSKETSQGLMNKDLANEVVVDEPPYGWVYPPNTKVISRMKTLHLYLPDEVADVEVTGSTKGRKDTLHEEHESTPPQNSKFISSVEEANTVKSSPRTSLRKAASGFRWSTYLRNPFSRAWHAVEDWWDSDEKPAAGGGSATPVYPSPYGQPTPNVQPIPTATPPFSTGGVAPLSQPNPYNSASSPSVQNGIPPYQQSPMSLSPPGTLPPQFVALRTGSRPLLTF